VNIILSLIVELVDIVSGPEKPEGALGPLLEALIGRIGDLACGSEKGAAVGARIEELLAKLEKSGGLAREGPRLR